MGWDCSLTDLRVDTVKSNPLLPSSRFIFPWWWLELITVTSVENVPPGVENKVNFDGFRPVASLKINEMP